MSRCIIKINIIKWNSRSGDWNETREGRILNPSIFWGNRWNRDRPSCETLRKMNRSYFRNSIQCDIVKDKFQLTCSWIAEIRWVVMKKRTYEVVPFSDCIACCYDYSLRVLLYCTRMSGPLILLEGTLGYTFRTQKSSMQIYFTCPVLMLRESTSFYFSTVIFTMGDSRRELQYQTQITVKMLKSRPNKNFSHRCPLKLGVERHVKITLSTNF